MSNIITREAAALIPGDAVLSPKGYWLTVLTVKTNLAEGTVTVQGHGDITGAASFTLRYVDGVECRTR